MTIPMLCDFRHTLLAVSLSRRYEVRRNFRSCYVRHFDSIAFANKLPEIRSCTDQYAGGIATLCHNVGPEISHINKDIVLRHD